MAIPDLNLLITLNILIEEGSVSRAAERLGTSAPSVSRALAKIRETVGDPILVRAGRELVPTPRALEIQQRVHELVEEATILLRPEGQIPIANLERQFVVRANDGFIGTFATSILSALREKAPKVTIRFAPEGESDDDALREGRVDLDIGALRPMGPEVRVQTIFRDQFVGVARSEHPIFDSEMTATHFSQFEQISTSRRGRARGPIDRALGDLGLERHIGLIVPTFHAALFALPHSDLIGLIPSHVWHGAKRLGMELKSFPIPVSLDTVIVAQTWHPRMDKDPAHQFLRTSIKNICKSV